MNAHALYASLKLINFKEFLKSGESQYLFTHQMERGESQTMGQPRPVSVLSNF